MPLIIVLGGFLFVVFRYPEMLVVAALASAAVVFIFRRIRARRAWRFEQNWPETLDPVAFEHACATALRQSGWSARVVGSPADQGADIIAERNGVTVAVQCKLHSRLIGNRAVQQALAGRVYHRATKAAVVATMPYSVPAQALAARSGVYLLQFEDLRRAGRILGVA